MSILKDIRFMSLLVLVVVAVAMIGAPMFLKINKVTVSSVDPSSKCSVVEGDVVSEIYATIITDTESFVKSLRNVKAGERVTMMVNGNPVGCVAIADRSLGFDVKEQKLETLKFGIDIEGGTRVLLNPAEPVTKEELTETVLLQKSLSIILL